MCVSQMFQNPVGVIHWEIQDSTSDVLATLNGNMIVVCYEFSTVVNWWEGNVEDKKFLLLA